MNVKVSIIIPIYNCERHLDRCLTSAINQTISPKEIVCIDDGSTDNSYSILKSFAQKYNFIKIYSQQNQGSGRARNLGLSHANGDYVCFLDADDFYINQSALEKMYACCIKNKVKACSAFRQTINSEGTIRKHNLHREICLNHPCGVLMQYSDYQEVYHYHNYIFKLDVIKQNEISFPDYRRYQDPPFFLNLMLNIENFWILPTEFYCYRIDDSNCFVNKQQANMEDTLSGMLDCMLIAQKRNLFKLKGKIIYSIIHAYLVFLTQPSEKEKELLEKIDECINAEEKEKIDLYDYFYCLLIDHYHNNIISFLESHGFSNIVVYGLGMMGQIFINAMKPTNISIGFGIDKNISEYENLKVINDLSMVDQQSNIVVTPFYPLGAEIKQSLISEGFTNVLTLYDIISESANY